LIRALLALVLVSSATQGAADPLLFHNGRLFISAHVNGVATEALLDSGAEATLVDPGLASRAKLPQGTPQVMKGSGGSVPARIVEGARIEALGVDLRPDAIVVLDLADLSSRLVKRPTKAIIGRELFDAARLRIDIDGGKISVVDRAARPPGLKLPLADHAGIESIKVAANGVPAKADFDLGNGSDVLISRDLVKKLHLRIIGKKSGGGIGGAIDRDLVKLKSLDVAGKRFRGVLAAVDDQSSHNDLNVGTSILRNFLITTDFTERSVWLAPASTLK